MKRYHVWGSMHISGGVSVAYRRITAEAEDPAAKQAEMEGRLEAPSSPFHTAEAFNVEDIIALGKALHGVRLRSLGASRCSRPSSGAVHAVNWLIGRTCTDVRPVSIP